jgi:hypothetical protein
MVRDSLINLNARLASFVIMSVKSTFHFNERKYRDKISKEDTETLIRKHHIKTMRFSACGVGLAAGTGAAILFTGGIGAVGPIYAGRQAIINHKQQKIIEKELVSREEDKPNIRKRDVMLGASIGGATAIVTFGIAPVVVDHLATTPLVNFAASAVHGALPAAHHIAHTAVQQMTTSHTTYLAGHAASQAAQEFGRGIQDTFVTQAHEAAAPSMNNTVNIAVNSFANNGPFYALGVQAVIEGEGVATSTTARYGLGRAGEPHIQNETRRKLCQKV